MCRQEHTQIWLDSHAWEAAVEDERPDSKFTKTKVDKGRCRTRKPAVELSVDESRGL